jgi:hypothetical protein
MPGATTIDFLTGLLSFLFTLLILSYVVSDNPAFRVALHAFVGVSSGYILYVVWSQVIVNKLVLPLVIGSWFDRLFLAIPLFLAVLLLGKLWSGTEWLGRPVVAFLVGIGTAAAIGGAVMGTIFPQVAAAADPFDINSSATTGGLTANLMIGAFALIGTIVTLAYFQFTIRGGEGSTGKRGWFANFFALPGKAFISAALGAIFAGVLAAALAACVDRVQSILDFIMSIPRLFL